MQQNTEFIIKMEFKIHVLNLVLIYQSVYLSPALIEEQLDMTTSVKLTVDWKTCLARENVWNFLTKSNIAETDLIRWFELG